MSNKKQNNHSLTIEDIGKINIDGTHKLQYNIAPGISKWLGFKEVHEKITLRAATSVRIKEKKILSALRLGTQWPDVPCEDLTKISVCEVKFLINKKIKTKLAYRTHYGDLQYWHSMSPSPKLTNQQLLEKIVAQAKKWYTNALKSTNHSGSHKRRGYFTLGKILHMIQDSFSHSHVIRGKDSTVIQFQSYVDQDPKKHSHADYVKGKKWDEIPGVNEAILHSKSILNFFQQKIPFSPKVENYFRTKIYKFAPGAASKKSGGSAPQFKQK